MTRTIASRRRGALRGRKSAAPSYGGWRAGMSGPAYSIPSAFSNPVTSIAHRDRGGCRTVGSTIAERWPEDRNTYYSNHAAARPEGHADSVLSLPEEQSRGKSEGETAGGLAGVTVTVTPPVTKRPWRKPTLREVVSGSRPKRAAAVLTDHSRGCLKVTWTA